MSDKRKGKLLFAYRFLRFFGFFCSFLFFWYKSIKNIKKSENFFQKKQNTP